MSNTVASSVGTTSGGEPSLTASAIVASDVKCGSHILRVDGYSRTKGLGKGRFIASEAFIVGGHRWCLHYYPDGHLLDFDCISVYLHLEDSTADEVKANFEISLLDQDGNPVPSFSKSSPLCRFSRSQGRKGMGYREFIKRNDLEESDYLKDDVFSVRCDVTVAMEIYTKTITVLDVRRGM